MTCLSKREEISLQIKEIVDRQTDQWGIDVENVKMQNIELPQDMKRAMAKQAEAERERRAVIITAEGEKAAAQAVADAARCWLKFLVVSISVRFKRSKKLASSQAKRHSLCCRPTLSRAIRQDPSSK